jgi:hypothetical protein
MPLTSDFGFTMRPSRRELVLVVAEDPAVRAAVAARLQEDGYSVLASAGPEEANATLNITGASVIVVATPRADALRLARPIPVVVLGDLEQIGDDVARAVQRPAG